MKGSVYTLRRKCGKATCACARGALHETVVVSWSEAGRTRLQQTVDRLLPLTGAGGVMVVTGERHVDAVRAQVPEVDAADVLAELHRREGISGIDEKAGRAPGARKE